MFDAPPGLEWMCVLFEGWWLSVSIVPSIWKLNAVRVMQLPESHGNAAMWGLLGLEEETLFLDAMSLMAGMISGVRVDLGVDCSEHASIEGRHSISYRTMILPAGSGAAWVMRF